MGRELGFWKNKKDIKIKNNEIYAKLSNGEYLDYICDIPSEQILQSIKYEFAGWKQMNKFCYENQDESFHLFITKQFVRADCYSLTKQEMNKIIDVLIRYDCPLYDPSIDVRFDENWS